MRDSREPRDPKEKSLESLGSLSSLGSFFHVTKINVLRSLLRLSGEACGNKTKYPTLVSISDINACQRLNLFYHQRLLVLIMGPKGLSTIVHKQPARSFTWRYSSGKKPKNSSPKKYFLFSFFFISDWSQGLRKTCSLFISINIDLYEYATKSIRYGEYFHSRLHDDRGSPFWAAICESPKRTLGL